MTMPSRDRQRLASALRELRKKSGLSTTELANRLGCSQPKVSKTELGRTLPDAADVEAWARATGADPQTRRELVAIAGQEAIQATEWRRQIAPGRRRRQEDIHRMEAAASVIRVFAPSVVVGLAQTRDYAKAMFRLGRKGGPPEALDDIVRARIARQSVLDQEDKRFFLLIAENALRRRLVPAPAMREQLERLVRLSTRSNIALGVIPYDADEQVHQYHGFTIIGDPAVDEESIALAETVTRSITVRSAREVAEYIGHFEALRSAAVEGDELRRLLRRVIDDLPDNQ